MAEWAATFNAGFEESKPMSVEFTDDEKMRAGFGDVQLVHTDNYNDLYNKPSINEVELKGNKTFEDLGDRTLSNIEIKAVFDRVFGG